MFWLGVWQAAAVAIGQEVFLVSPVQAIGTLVELLPQAEFWQRIGFSAGRILLGFGLGVLSSAVLAVAAEKWEWVDALLAPVMQLVKATPVASFIILALVWVSGSSLSVLISFLMVLPVLYSAVRTGIGSADRQLLEMAQVFRLPLGRRLRAVWLPAVLPAFRQGCSVALGICWKSGVAAEVIGLPDGSIGDALYRAKITLSTGELFAWTFVIILLSAVFEKLFLALLDKAVAAVLGEEGAEKMSGTNNKLEIKNLSKRFGEKILFENLSLTVDGPAVLWAPSGWGKTTLLRILMGLEAPTSGSVEGVGRVGAVFQEDRLCPQLTAEENVALVLTAEQYKVKTQYKEQIRDDLIQLGLDDEALALPARKLSGGQKRRTALLRALWAESDTLLLDEPFTGMDPAVMKKAAAMLKARCGRKPTLLATHDQEAIRELGWKVIELG